MPRWRAAWGSDKIQQMDTCDTHQNENIYWDVYCNGEHEAAGEKWLLATEEMAVPDQSSTSNVKGQIWHDLELTYYHSKYS